MGEATSAVLAVDKPVGPTSHDIVAAVRRAMGTRRAGHTGTLDPFASGLLMVCVGAATRLSEYLTGLPKTYLAQARFGSVTETDDLDGAVIRENPGWRDLDRAALEALLVGMVGETEQLPPIYSAKKVDGERAHRRARRGEEFALAPAPVRIHRMELVSWDPPDLGFRVSCSSGTYIRSIARDLGEATGVGAHLVALRREAIGTFEVAHAFPGAELERGSPPGYGWVPPADAVGHLAAVSIRKEDLLPLRQGRCLEVGGAPDAPQLDAGTMVRILEAGALVAIGEWKSGSVQPRKVLV